MRITNKEMGLRLDKQLAKKHFDYLHDAWIDDELKHYEEYHKVEDADLITTSRLEEGNYKDLRVVQEFFKEYLK
tara:strand:- start:36 stop:257 length:222 start_codon:yes stop_codon:yes gene_type:complete